ncbi:hypothetical protein AB3S75_018790 [Citrus x aurantiifolia]
MAAILKFLPAIILFTIITKGNCHCTLDNIKISQSQTGKTVPKKQEWRVTLNNTCICTQSELKLSCKGFQTVVPIDPSIIAISGDECTVVNNGKPFYGFTTLSFNYAWDTSFPFKPVSSQISCS